MSKLFYREKTITGIDIGQTAIKVMSLDAHHSEVLAYGSVDLDANRIQQALKDGDSNYITDSLTTLLNDKVSGAIGSRKVSVSIPTALAFTRTLSLPAKAERALKSAVELEAEQYIPVPLAGLTIDYEIIGRTAEELRILVCAAPQNITSLISQSIEKVGMEVVSIEPSLMAVGRLLAQTENATMPTLVVDIGAVVTDIAAFDKGFVRVTGSTATGGNSFTLNIAKTVGVSLEQAHQLKVLYGLGFSTKQQQLTEALSPDLDAIISDVKKLIAYYNDRLDGPTIEQLLIVGSGANIPGIGEYFTNALVLAARVANPWQEINFGKLNPPARQVKPRYITVAGTASVTDQELWK